jgi:hypothetical protein
MPKQETSRAHQVLRKDFDKLTSDYFQRVDRIKELKYELEKERALVKAANERANRMRAGLLHVTNCDEQACTACLKIERNVDSGGEE